MCGIQANRQLKVKEGMEHVAEFPVSTNRTVRVHRACEANVRVIRGATGHELLSPVRGRYSPDRGAGAAGRTRTCCTCDASGPGNLKREGRGVTHRAGDTCRVVEHTGLGHTQ